MALSNWLTRGEWNAVFIAGLLDENKDNLGEIMQEGISRLHKAGYRFQGIDSDENGNYDKLTQCCQGNETVLAEWISGEFDARGRAKEGLIFIEKHVPSLRPAFDRLVKELEEPGEQK